ncbi:thioredoxin family protein [Gracilibacillus marinus]|uniref:Thioredoxin family protein n=1 Tax=Gracilibacillus marinus TaxID=630535 RepID=A0ABV8W0S5_9BACI
MKKMLIFVIVLLVIFGALFFVVNYQNEKASEGNPYNKKTLDQATIDQLDNPLYQNQILPEELADKIENGESVTVYFYSPTCVYCQRTTPVVVPMTEDLGIDLVKLNLLEFQEQGQVYGIQSTPTIIHFEDGKEVNRVVGEQPESTFEYFFNEIK